MKNFIFLEYIFLIIFIPLYCIGVSGNEDAVDSPFVIQVDDTFSTANLKNIPLKKVLTEVAKQTSTKIASLVSTEEFLMADFSRLPIEKGLSCYSGILIMPSSMALISQSMGSLR